MQQPNGKNEHGQYKAIAKSNRQLPSVALFGAGFQCVRNSLQVPLYGAFTNFYIESIPHFLKQICCLGGFCVVDFLFFAEGSDYVEQHVAFARK